MSARKSIFALAALATLSVAALAPTSASAFGGRFGGEHFGGSHFGGHFGGDHFGWRFGGNHFDWRFRDYGWGHRYGYGWGHGLGYNSGIHICPLVAGGCPPLPRPMQPYPPRYTGFPHYWPHYEPRYEPRFGFGIGHGPVVATGAGAASAPAPMAMASGGAPSGGPSRGCLTKQELPDGSALFRDMCTQEQAESQPQGGAPAQ